MSLGWVYLQCAVGWIPSGTLVIAFRGTASFKNVAADIKFFSHRVSFHLVPSMHPAGQL